MRISRKQKPRAQYSTKEEQRLFNFHFSWFTFDSFCYFFPKIKKKKTKENIQLCIKSYSECLCICRFFSLSLSNSNKVIKIVYILQQAQIYTHFIRFQENIILNSCLYFHPIFLFYYIWHLIAIFSTNSCTSSISYFLYHLHSGGKTSDF